MIWFSGLLVLELLSLHAAFDIDQDSITPEPNLEGTLQDLLHDPIVLEYKRRFKPPWSYDEA